MHSTSRLQECFAHLSSQDFSCEGLENLWETFRDGERLLVLESHAGLRLGLPRFFSGHSDSCLVVLEGLTFTSWRQLGGNSRTHTLCTQVSDLEQFSYQPNSAKVT
jgi:hypothetical protein